MYKKRKIHDYAARLKYMHMLENGFSVNYIETHFGINHKLLGYLWARYQAEGSSGLLKKQNVKANYAFKLQVLRDIKENHLTLAVVKIMLNREIENKIKNRFLTINAFFIMILN